jgi:thiamine kinase-like enzyme
VVVKEFSGIASARRTGYALASDKLAGSKGLAPAILYDSLEGSIHVNIAGRTLTERDIAGASGALQDKVASILASLHSIPLDTVETEAAASGVAVPAKYKSQAMVWTSIDVMLDMIEPADKSPVPIPNERTWDIDIVRKMCEAEREAIDKLGYPLALCHGDMKPSNLIQEDGGQLKMIDFELAGPNYRGFDICKLFRNDTGPVEEEDLRRFVTQYLGGSADPAAVDALVAEAKQLEKLTWLEAAVFFMAMLSDCSGQYSAEEIEQAEKLAEHRWQRYLACTDVPQPSPAGLWNRVKEIGSSPGAVGVIIGLSYSLCYFWRTPIFVFPPEVLRQSIGTLFGRDLSLALGFSLAFTLGFGVSKPPAVTIMTGNSFLNNRLAALIGLMTVSMLIQNIGLYIFADNPLGMVASVFLSCFFQSWIYGGMFTYLEGRRATELMVATVTGLYSFAGPASRALV